MPAPTESAALAIAKKPAPEAKPDAPAVKDALSKKEKQATPTPAETVAAGGAEAAEALIQAERERVKTINAMSREQFPKIAAKAIDEGWTPQKASQEMQAALYAQTPKADFSVQVKQVPTGQETQKVLTAALSLRAGISGEDLHKEYGDAVIEGAHQHRTISLTELLQECIKLEGGAGASARGNELIRASFSTTSLPGILSNVAQKRLLRSFQAQKSVAPRLCRSGDLNDFKESQRYRLSDVDDLEPLSPDGEIVSGRVSEEKATNQLETFAKLFTLTRQMIINDDMGAFLQVPGFLGAKAAKLVDQLFFARLLSNPKQTDNKALFHTAHHNLLTGGNSALSHDALADATTAFLNQVDSENEPISVEPRFLLVPNALRYEATRLVTGKQLLVAAPGTGGSEPFVMPTINALAEENLQVVSSPYLSSPKYSGSSDKSWYLFASPEQIDTFEIGHLKGKRVPTVEKGTTDFDILGIRFRVYYDVGVREQDWRGVFKATGV